MPSSGRLQAVRVRVQVRVCMRVRVRMRAQVGMRVRVALIGVRTNLPPP
ncbi:hypothetical protein OG292_05115 [Streptomyces sp. NBC_01511]